MPCSCPSLQTRGYLSTPGQVRCLLLRAGQVGLGFGSLSMGSGPTPLAGCVRHQFAVCTRGALSVLDATEQTQKCCGGKNPPQPHCSWVEVTLSPEFGPFIWPGRYHKEWKYRNQNTKFRQMSFLEWWTPVVQNRWLALPCIPSHIPKGC